MPVSANLSNGLDKAFENATLDEVLDASPAALAGVSDADAQHLRDAFGIKTVRDFGSNKYFALAGVLVALGNKTG